MPYCSASSTICKSAMWKPELKQSGVCKNREVVLRDSILKCDGGQNKWENFSQNLKKFCLMKMGPPSLTQIPHERRVAKASIKMLLLGITAILERTPLYEHP
ncbi:hypothetical protein CEXT_18601 [Caerostris extrusa]|uniref:Uncharacterized protein n=1 Tax=Caerostris extrusa TaxID=172846 RepID=A0AAV4RCT3_CAEEX|nr:hypothetical protein CEXT_18601 [Caerostris extrusa]